MVMDSGSESLGGNTPPASKRFDRGYLRAVRYTFQWALFFFVLYGGYRLYIFTDHFMGGGSPPVERPQLVDGFLPIGSLMTLKLWLTRGIFDPVHPAGLVILGAALAMSLALKKTFCGWICPVGALSELLYKAGGRAIGRNLAMPGYLDYPLRSLKYLLMGFFLYVVFVRMDAQAVTAFLNTPYWKVADVKMLRFFTAMTATTALVLVLLVLLSLVFKNFWCRYLCPYGALVGLLSYLSPFKVTRDEKACIHCKRCTAGCPSLLRVEEKTRVRSPECTGCLTCVSRCPAPGALDMAAFGPKGRMIKVKPMVFAALAVLVFFGLIWSARLTGHWRSNVTYEQYKSLVPMVSRFEHP